jgi:hypothetical protein
MSGGGGWNERIATTTIRTLNAMPAAGAIHAQRRVCGVRRRSTTKRKSRNPTTASAQPAREGLGPSL